MSLRYVRYVLLFCVMGIQLGLLQFQFHLAVVGTQTAWAAASVLCAVAMVLLTRPLLQQPGRTA